VSPAVTKLGPKTIATPSSPLPDEEVDDDFDDFIVTGEVNEDEIIENDFSVPTAITNPLLFSPIFNLSVWKDPNSKDQCVSVAVLLPTGIGEKPDDLSICVEDENVLKITVMWPTAMTCIGLQESPVLKSRNIIRKFKDSLLSWKSFKTKKVMQYTIPLG